MSEASLTLPTLLCRNAEQHADTRVIVTPDSAITHRALDTESRALAARFAAAGIGKGARVGIVMPNGIEWAVVAAAVTRIGGVIVPLSTLLRPPELEAQLQVADVSHLVVAREFRGRRYLDDLEAIAPGIVSHVERGQRHAALPSLRAIWAADTLPDPAVDDAIVTALEARVTTSDDFAVMFTSGSRGTPKGTIHTHGSALRAVAAGLDARRVTADDRIYIPMPFFWTGGLATGVLTAIVTGATLLTEAIPHPAQTLALMERERATLFRGWPDQAAALVAHPRFAHTDLSSLGPSSLPALLPADVRPKPGSRANLLGMTETFGPYSGARGDVDLPPGKHGSCGRLLPGVEARILDPDTGAVRAPGEAGEICLRGPNVMRGICGRTPEETFDADGYYHSGDLGSLDADGYLWFHGRADDMFKVKGATVYPSEVEAALRAIDGVQQANVTNVRDHRGIDAVGAFIVSTRSIDELAGEARKRLSAFKVPTRWLVSDSADDAPLTATAKIDKPALQELLLRKGSSG